MRVASAVALLVVGACAGPERSNDSPLTRAHAHNDYLHTHPLADALDHRFCSVEADVFPVGGALLVAHQRSACREERTLDSLYLGPLIERTRAGQGHIYPGLAQPFTLLVDIKTHGEDAYRLLNERLKAAPDVFTEFDRGVVYPRAVTVIVSGDTPRGTMAGEARRFAFVDGRASDLKTAMDASAPTGLVPLVSMPWQEHLKWDGKGRISDDERMVLTGLVKAAHDRGYRIRFWGVPEREEAWRTLYECGVDLINADDLGRAAATLRGMPGSP